MKITFFKGPKWTLGSREIDDNLFDQPDVAERILERVADDLLSFPAINGDNSLNECRDQLYRFRSSAGTTEQEEYLLTRDEVLKAVDRKKALIRAKLEQEMRFYEEDGNPISDKDKEAIGEQVDILCDTVHGSIQSLIGDCDSKFGLDFERPASESKTHTRFVEDDYELYEDENGDGDQIPVDELFSKE